MYHKFVHRSKIQASFFYLGQKHSAKLKLMAERKRYLQSQILKDLQRKMVFVAGPRQVGKTTLALGLPGWS